MPTNPHVNLHFALNEQQLLDDLVMESIQFHGMDFNYLPREIVNFDEVYGEDTISRYELVFPIEMYIKSVYGFEGDGQFASKFGFEVRDQLTINVSVTRFDEILKGVRIRPQEGDLIYLPLTNSLFVIKYAKSRHVFYALGSLQTYELVCEMFEYSSEELSTGVDAIDSLMGKYSTDAPEIDDINLDLKPNDSNADNETFQAEGNTYISWDPGNPFGEI